ncbi:MAG: hypothetical protein ABIS14_08690, partial [Sphingomonas sp.]
MPMPLVAAQTDAAAQADAAGRSSEMPGLVPALPHIVTHGRELHSRLSGSFWLLARSGSGVSNGVVGGQLGGSQVGVRLAYALDRRRRIALAGRL